MPLTKKGSKIMRAMRKTYGDDAEEIFYRTKNKGKIKGVDRKRGKRGK